MSADPPKPELSSILTQVQTLQTDREKLMRELENAKQKVEKLTEGKRAEMKTSLDTVIAKWLEDSVENEGVQTQFKEGMQRLVQNTAEDSGVWQVVVCASAAGRAGAAAAGARGAQDADDRGVCVRDLTEAAAGRCEGADDRLLGRV